MVDIRETTRDDAEALPTLYDAAFPEESLTGLVAELLALEEGVLSLGAYEGSRLVGHVIFTDGMVGAGRAGLLGPLCVHPDQQRQGIGSALIAKGHRRLAAAGVAQIFVLGDPNYYGRSGYGQEEQVKTPCPIPEDWAAAWQSQTLGGRTALGPGVLQLPEPWMVPALWSD